MTKNEMFEFLSNGIPINGQVIIETTYRAISGMLIAMNDTALLLDCGINSIRFHYHYKV